MHRVTRRASLGLVAAALLPPTARAAFGEPIFLDGLGVAINGYDPVAYFLFEEAIRGSYDHELRTKEGNWWFAEARNRAMFVSAPDKYIPQFGGYCAEAMARGFKRRSDPTLWVMIDNKVYLHYSVIDQNRWAEDIRGNIRAAEENWTQLKFL